MTRVAIVGRGRVGGALAANLADHPGFDVAPPVGRDADIADIAHDADMVLLAVTDANVASVAAAITPNDDALFVHFAGSLTLDALAPHRRRASLHPLTPMPGDPGTAARRLRGAWMAVAGDPACGRTGGRARGADLRRRRGPTRPLPRHGDDRREPRRRPDGASRRATRPCWASRSRRISTSPGRRSPTSRRSVRRRHSPDRSCAATGRRSEATSRRSRRTTAPRTSRSAAEAARLAAVALPDDL